MMSVRAVPFSVAMEDARLMKGAVGDLSTHERWLVLGKVATGERLTTRRERRIYRECTGRRTRPKALRELYIRVGRKAGKTKFAGATLAVYKTLVAPRPRGLPVSDMGHVLICARDKAQAQIMRRYIGEIIARNPLFAARVVRESMDEIEFSNNMIMRVQSADWRTVRGFNVVAAFLDEAAYFESEESQKPDVELLAAIRPSTAMIGDDALIVVMSSPCGRTGILWNADDEFYGVESDTVLVWGATTRQMNPTISQKWIDEQIARDPAKARAEYLAEYRDDIGGFLDDETIRACVVVGRGDLPVMSARRVRRYFGFLDPSGGRSDSMAAAVGHLDTSTEDIIIDAVMEKKAPFKPMAEAEKFADMFKSYRISEIESDAYAGEWVSDRFAAFGIKVKKTPLTKSELYLAMIPALSERSVQLPDLKILFSQLCGLERRMLISGRESIDHRQGQHDDVANVAAGVVAMIQNAGRGGGYFGDPIDVIGDPDNYGGGESADVRADMKQWIRDQRKMDNEN